MSSNDLHALIAAVNAPLTDPAMNVTVGSGAPRFELYHFALSVCSQKVRTCLGEKAAPYVAHDINLSMPNLGNYDPAYVRLRMRGAAGRQMVAGYSGRSGISTEGFDPAVVPTLIDLAKGSVHVDSVQICNHIDAAWESGTALIPDRLRGEVAYEMAVVDGTPHVAVLYGAHPDRDFRPERLRKSMPGVHDRKIEKIRHARSLEPGDPLLVAALDAKIRKEEAAKSFVATPGLMRSAVSEIVDIVAGLDGRLADGRTWICGDDFTMADIFWAVSLFRLKWLGMAFCWEGNDPLNRSKRPAVRSYADRLFARQSFRDAVIDWPGIPRTEYVQAHYS